MQKRGFTMYSKAKNSVSIYRNYTPKLKNYQDTELRAYIGGNIAHNVSKNVAHCVRQMTRDVAQGITGRKK